MRQGRRTLAVVVLLLAWPLWSLAEGARARRGARKHRARVESAISAKAANDAAKTPTLRAGDAGSAVLRAQVLLDRAHFSPGEIGGRFDGNTRRAVAAYEKSQGDKGDGVLGPKTWKRLGADSAPVVVPYVILDEDVAGPFAEVPEDMMEKAKLPALSYASPLEGLAEKFHANPELLRRINPKKTFDQAGTEILVPAVHRDFPAKAAKVVVDAADRSVVALDGEGRLLARYPASVGSAHDPLPVGRWTIKGRRLDPQFHYNPELFWDAEPDSTRATIAPGPNNPVGRVWIDLSKPHYGIHGTPEPGAIGKTQSHGCIRLTNWDALELAGMISTGTPAILEGQ